MKKNSKKMVMCKALKRSMCIALAAMMLACASGCSGGSAGSGADSSSSSGKNKDIMQSNVAQAKTMSENYVFATNDMNVTGMEGELVATAINGDYLYALTNQWTPDATNNDAESEEYVSGTSIYRIYKISKEGGAAEKVFESEDLKDDYIYNLDFNQDGTPIVCRSSYEANTENETRSLCRIEGNKLVQDYDLDKLPLDGNDMFGVLVDKNNNVVIYTDTEIKIYDREMKEVAVKSFQNVYIYKVNLTKDNDIAAIMETYDEKENEGAAKIVILDVNSYEVKKECVLDKFSYGGGIVKGNGAYDLYYSTNNGIYGYMINDEKSEKIVDYSASDINSGDLGTIIMLDENTFIAAEYTWAEDSIKGSTFKLNKYTKVDPSDVADRVVLTYASIYGNEQVKRDIKDFNNSQSKYRINIVDYSEENDPYAKLSADIAAGNLPDIYELYDRIGDISLEQMISKGLIEDMAPYIEKDSDTNLDDLVPAVKNAISKDGKVYVLSPCFSLYTLVGRASEVGKEPGWNFDEMKKYLDTKKDVQLFYSNNKTDILRAFMEGCGNEFIDWENGKCNFDSQDFKEILEIANRGTNEEFNYDEDAPSEPKMIMDGKRAFVDGIISPDDMNRMDKVFKGDYCIKGYPGSKKSGSSIYLDNMLAISSKCENKDAAWEFVKRYLTEDYQGKNYRNMWGLPTRKDVLEVYFESRKATKETKDKYGNDIIPLNGSYGWEDLQLKMEPDTDETINTFKDALEHADGLWTTDKAINDIVAEEAKAFFAGDKSLDEVVNLIQNRVNTYINENK